MHDFLLANWDTIGLLVTNFLAWLVQSPLKKRL